MTAERSRSTSKWIDLDTNSVLRELAESHAALLHNISKRTANVNDSPKQTNKKIKKDRPLPSSRTKRELDAEPTPSWPAPKKVVTPSKRGGNNSTYTFNRNKLPGLVARAKELVKKWHEPKLPNNRLEEVKRKIRESCHVYTINHSKAERDNIKPTNPLYISMELRKSLIRHDWAGVKKLLKVLLRCPVREDFITWKLVMTTLYYYPGAEPMLREFIERNRLTFASSDIRRGLLEINGMVPYTHGNSSKWTQEDMLSAMGDGEGQKRDDPEEILIFDSDDDAE